MTTLTILERFPVVAAGLNQIHDVGLQRILDWDSDGNEMLLNGYNLTRLGVG